jgi:hypothetical protein
VDRSGTQSEKGDAIMMKYFTPPIAVPIAVLALVLIAAFVRIY